MKTSLSFNILILLIFAGISTQYVHAQNRGERFRQFREIQKNRQPSNNDDLKSIIVNGIERQYLLREPSRNNSKTPLVIVLHGGGGNGSITERMTGFTPLAIRENFAVVYPNGSGRQSNMLLTWNAKHCCGYAMENHIDDVTFISNLIDKLVRENNIDPNRIYVTGMSNGAMMTHRIGRELSNKIAAIATDVGTLFGDEPPPQSPVPALIINGMLDTNVPYNGGTPNGMGRNAWNVTNIPPASAQATYWASYNGCDLNPLAQTYGQIISKTYSCPVGNEVIQISVKDGAHSWFGGQAGRNGASAPSQSYDSTKEIWNFFKSHHN